MNTAPSSRRMALGSCGQIIPHTAARLVVIAPADKPPVNARLKQTPRCVISVDPCDRSSLNHFDFIDNATVLVAPQFHFKYAHSLSPLNCPRQPLIICEKRNTGYPQHPVLIKNAQEKHFDNVSSHPAKRHQKVWEREGMEVWGKASPPPLPLQTGANALKLAAI
ncbi:hypothetical protein DWB63_12850 [Pseudodesulfovibrio sp. S3]|nr:hypothetical protein DWB63_12850 [Pseudodesulfovibrio sp. S3]